MSLGSREAITPEEVVRFNLRDTDWAHAPHEFSPDGSLFALRDERSIRLFDMRQRRELAKVTSSGWDECFDFDADAVSRRCTQTMWRFWTSGMAARSRY